MTFGERSHEPRAARCWKHGTAPVIGLTGGIASGKSSVASLFAELGSTVIDADSVGHAVLDLPAVRERLIGRFGPAVSGGLGGQSASGEPRVDRKALAGIVFADTEARQALEAIVHPLMRARFLEVFENEIGLHRPSGRSVVLDAAILREAGWDDLCDLVVFVDAPRSERLGRATLNRGWSEQDFTARESAQWPCERKRLRSDFEISSNVPLAAVRGEVERVLATLAGHDLPDSVAVAPSQSLTVSRPSGRHCKDGTGSDAWHDPCPVS
jgi:dephospho-CoA kinase